MDGLVFYLIIRLMVMSNSIFSFMIFHSYQPGFIILNGRISFLFNLVHPLAASNIHKDIKMNYRLSVLVD
jgi:hypothetical protein